MIYYKTSIKARLSEYEREFRRVRKEVLERDRFACVLCERPANEVHHIVYRSQGGTNDMKNLATLCTMCHKAAHGEFPFISAKDVRERLQDIVERR